MIRLSGLLGSLVLYSVLAAAEPVDGILVAGQSNARVDAAGTMEVGRRLADTLLGLLQDE